MKRLFWSTLGVGLSALLFLGCPQTGIVCQPGTNRCGSGCADYTSDRRNCGGCAQACQAGEFCQNSQCICQEGATRCGGACVVLSTDPQNCGACGNACTTDQVCEPDSQGGASCKIACGNPGNTQCGQSCVSVESDPQNCGSCGHVCLDGRACKSGVCSYDVVFACLSYGQVVGVRSTDGGVFKGPLTALGTSPFTLAAYQDILLSGDSTDQKIYEAGLEDFLQIPDAGANIENGVNQIVVNAPYVYVVNSISGTLQILQMNGDAGLVVADGGEDAGVDAGEVDAGELDAGLADAGEDAGIADAGDAGGPPPPLHPNGLMLTTVGEVNFGASSYPEGAAVLGTNVYVPLYGDFTTGAGGSKIARVDVTNPTAPTIAESYDLTTLNLEGFADAGAPIPRPYAITAFNGKIYAVLSNLDATYQPAGPGLLAELTPADGGLSAVDLNATICLNPVWAQASGDSLYVACTGRTDYTTFVSTEGVVRVAPNGTTGQLEVKSSWAPSCPTGQTCLPAIGRLGVVGNRVFVADQASGKVWILDNTGGTLTEVPNISPLQACAPTDSSHPYSNVSDVLPLP